MRKGRLLAGVVAVVIGGAFMAESAHGVGTSATGTVTGVPDGPDNFLYTVTLNNTGTTNIDTFWFAWLPDNYDFLDSVPTPTKTPANWTAAVETGYYGSSIQFYDTGSSPIAMGTSNNSFQFTSPDSPTTLAGDNFFGLPETYSYVYSNAPAGPLQDPTGTSSVIFSMPVSTPEPASIATIGLAGAIGLMARRRRSVAVTMR